MKKHLGFPRLTLLLGAYAAQPTGIRAGLPPRRRFPIPR